MRNISWILALCMLAPLAEAAGEKLPTPTIFPLPGTYSNTTSLSLMDAVPDAEIHYTWDGSDPSASSPVFDPRAVLFMAGVYDGNKGLKTGYTLRAVAMKTGMAPRRFGHFFLHRRST